MELHEIEGILMRAVVLSSGGLDSSVLMLMMKREGIEIWPLHVNYGQISESQEWQASRKICAHLNVALPERIDLSDLGRIQSGLTSGDPLGSVFYPARNLLLLTLGASFAYSKRIDTVAIGLISNAVFPDQTRTFVNAAETAISESIGHPMSVLAPLLALDKRDIIKLARTYGLPIESTYSCHAGGLSVCGLCAACTERQNAEADLSKEEGKGARFERTAQMRLEPVSEGKKDG